MGTRRKATTPTGTKAVRTAIRNLLNPAGQFTITKPRRRNAEAFRSCRPYPGAVIWPVSAFRRYGRRASIAPPLFRGGYRIIIPSTGLTLGWLQSCRPYPGAVMLEAVVTAIDGWALQSCRPYPGAVTYSGRTQGFRGASCFNRAAPIPGRLSAVGDTKIDLFVGLQSRRPIPGRLWNRKTGPPVGCPRFNFVAPETLPKVFAPSLSAFLSLLDGLSMENIRYPAKLTKPPPANTIFIAGKTKNPRQNLPAPPQI